MARPCRTCDQLSIFSIRNVRSGGLFVPSPPSHRANALRAFHYYPWPGSVYRLSNACKHSPLDTLSSDCQTLCLKRQKNDKHLTFIVNATLSAQKFLFQKKLEIHTYNRYNYLALHIEYFAKNLTYEGTKNSTQRPRS